MRELAVPKIALVAPARDGGTIASRYLMPYAGATAYAVTGGTCLAVASCIEGTVAYDSARLGDGSTHEVAIEHPQGKMFVTVEVIDGGGGLDVKQASHVRHARELFEGKVFVPASVWAGPERVA